MNKNFRIAGIAITILVFSGFLYPQQPDSQSSPDPMQLVKRVSEAYRDLSSYEIRAVVITEQHWDEVRELTEVPVVMAEDKAGKFRVESKHPLMGGLEVSDGKTIWEYAAMGHQYTKKAASAGLDVADDAPLMPTNYVKRYRELAAKTSEARLLREETLTLEEKDVPCEVIEVEFGNDPAMQKKQESAHTFWIDKENALVLQEMWDSKSDMMGISSQTRTTVVYKAIHIGPPAETLFGFSPPLNAKEVGEIGLPGMSARRAPAKGPSKEFTLQTLDGQKTSLSDFKGKIVLLDFWATWCVPCRESAPVIEKVHSEFSSKGLIALAVDYGEEERLVRGYLDHNPSELANLLDPNKTVADLYQVGSVPTFILISKDGKVAYRAEGFGDDTEANLRAALKREGLQ